MESKPTVGEKAKEIIEKNPERIDIGELRAESDKAFSKELDKIIESHKNYAPIYYIQVVFKKERLMQNVIRRQFIVRKSAPEPWYDTSLFSYSNAEECLKYHWSIPDEDTCLYLLHEPNLRPEDKSLAKMVKKFADGTLEL